MASFRDKGKPPRALVAALILLAFSIFINYVDRGNLGTAASLVKNELNLSATQLGFLLTAVFITYVPMQPIVGWLVDRFGGSRVLVGGFLIWSLATVLSGFAISFAALFACRLLLGVGESVSFPGVSHVVAELVPPRLLGFANGITQSGLHYGPAFGVFIGGLLIAGHGWRWVFIVFGLCGLLWIPAWLYVSRRSEPLRQVEPRGEGPTMKQILQHRSLWGTSTAHFCGNFSNYFMLTWIPYYLVHERHWSLSQMAVIAGITYLLGGTGQIVCGSLADVFIARGFSATLVRKTSCGIGAVGFAGCMIGCAYSSDAASALWLMLAGALGSFQGVNVYTISQTIAGPAATGRWVGVQNMLGNISGLIAPALTGILVDRTGNFILPLLIVAGVALCGGAAWIFMVGKCERYDWSSPESATPAVAAA